MERTVRYLAWASLPTFLALWPALSTAGESKAGVAVAVVGTATVSRVSLSAPVPLRFKDDVFLRDRIDTHERSIARLLLGGKALVTVKQLSEFTITDEPGRAAVDLQKGALSIGVAKSQLRPGEAVEIRTPNAVVAIRGSRVLVDVTWTAGVPRTEVVTLEVSRPVTVAARAAAVTLALAPYHTVTVTGEGTTMRHTPVRALSADESARLEKAEETPLRQHHAGLPPRVVDVMIEDAARLATRLGASPSALVVPASIDAADGAELLGPSTIGARPQPSALDATRAVTNAVPLPIPTTPLAPTPTLASPTTALPSPTNILPSPTTTLPSPTNVLPGPTTALPSPTTTLPTPTTTLPSPTSTIPTPTTTLPSPTTALPTTTLPNPVKLPRQ